jgi:DNA-binding SARP family transcriptional activator
MADQLFVRVLGGLRVVVGARPLVGLASAKANALLVYLAVTARRSRVRRWPGCSGAI